MIKLHLVLKKKYYDMIASGEKKEEYREITKHWISRIAATPYQYFYEFIPAVDFRPFTHVEFQLGYQTNAPRMLHEIKGIRIGTGRENWGAEPGKHYFIIELV